MPIKEREKKGRAIVTNEDIVHAEDGNGNRDAKVAPKMSVKRGKSAIANAKPCTKWSKESSGEKKGVRVEDMTKMSSFDEPINRKKVSDNS